MGLLFFLILKYEKVCFDSDDRLQFYNDGAV